MQVTAEYDEILHSKRWSALNKYQKFAAGLGAVFSSVSTFGWFDLRQVIRASVLGVLSRGALSSGGVCSFSPGIPQKSAVNDASSVHSAYF